MMERVLKFYKYNRSDSGSFTCNFGESVIKRGSTYFSVTNAEA